MLFFRIFKSKTTATICDREEDSSSERNIATEPGTHESTMRKRLKAENGVTALGLYKPVWRSLTCPTLQKTPFRSCGIWPTKPDIFTDQNFFHSSVTNPVRTQENHAGSS